MNMQHKQRGAALFVSLIFLLILTILGVASMNDTIMQGKMSGAVQDGNVAFQGAETAIRDAESYIESLASVGNFDNSGCLYDQDNVPNAFNTAIWTSTAGDDTCEANSLTGQTNAARYFIALSGTVKEAGSGLSLNLDSYSHESGAGQIFAFRIVARASGGTGNSQRIIETFYGRRF